MNAPVVILAAHGAGDGSVANESVRALAADIEGRVGAGRVLAAFHLGTPSFAQALDAVDSEESIIVPMLTSRGYFSQHVLPAALAGGANNDEKKIELLEPIGLWRKTREAIFTYVQESQEAFRVSCRDTVAVFVGHGTRRNAQSGASTLALAARWRMRTGQPTTAAFLDQAPLVQDVGRDMTGMSLVVYPFLLGGGPHVNEDIPAGLGVAPESIDAIPYRGQRTEGGDILLLKPLLKLPSLPDLVIQRLQRAESGSFTAIRADQMIEDGLLHAGPGARP